MALQFFLRLNYLDMHRTYGCAANPQRTRPLCDFCGRKFCQPQKLKVHIKRMHSGEWYSPANQRVGHGARFLFLFLGGSVEVIFFHYYYYYYVYFLYIYLFYHIFIIIIIIIPLFFIILAYSFKCCKLHNFINFLNTR